MWTLDAPCSRCLDKAECQDRIALITTVQPLVTKLTVEPEFANGPGDGIVIISCRDLRTA